MTISRRVFLKNGGFALVSLGFAPSFLARTAFAASSGRKQLITIFQRGAVDGLSVIVPHGEADYFRARPAIAVARPGQGESAQVFFSNARNWINLLDRVIERRLPVDTYLPGHGPVHIGRGVADLEEQRRYFVVMRDEVSKMIMAGKTVEQVQAEFKVPAEFAHYGGAARLKASSVRMT